MKKIGKFIMEHKVVISVVAVFVLLLIILTVVSIKKIYSASIDILVVPMDAKVVINGKEYKNGIYDNLKIGKYIAEISRDGFDPQTFELNLEADTRTRLYTFLEGDDEWYKNNDDENTKYLLDIIYEYRGEAKTQETIEKYPVLNSLPMVYEKYLNNYTEYVSFRIDGGKFEDCEKDFCLKISDISGGNRERALEYMREKGYNPDDYEIIYEDYSEKGSAY